MLDNFLTHYPFGKLSEQQKDSLSFILAKLSSSSIKDLRQQAYVIATIKHETGETYKPVVEGNYLKGNRVQKLYRYYEKENPKALKTIFPNGVKGINYLGRGFVQITHLANYQTFSKLLSIDLTGEPDLALIPHTAWAITELGMTRGLFTGKKLDDYFNIDETDFYHARQIINRMDKAELIKEYAEKTFQIIAAVNQTTLKMNDE
jgi:predicted chitinase